MYISIRDFTVKWVGYRDLFEGLEDLGIKGFELYVGRDLKTGLYVDMGYETKLGLDVSTKTERLHTKKLLENRGFIISAILIENDFSRNNLDLEVKYVKDACTVAYDLGVDTVRINSLMREIPGYTLEKYIDRMEKAVNLCLQKCKDLGVSLAVENHGIIGNREEFIREIYKRINDEHFGLTLDTGNFYWYGYPLSKVYEIIKEFAHLVKHTHFKNASVPENVKETVRKPGEVTMMPLYEGDIDLGKVIKILKSAGYDGDVNIEDESLGRFKGDQRIQVLKKDIEYLKTLI